MLVGKRMSKKVETLTPDDYLSTAQSRMWKGGFRRVPVVQDERLVGIITDHDLREHLGHLDRTRIGEVMAENPLSVAPEATLEEAAQTLLKNKIGGLPVVDGGKVVGIITASDILQAFLDVMGASVSGTVRIDLILEGKRQDLTSASKIIADEGGEILGLGTYREKWGESHVCYLRLRTSDPDSLAKVLQEKGYNVLGVHP